MRPVIGITSYAQDARWGVWHMPAALVPLAYVDSIERAGGRAIVIPPVEEDAEETLDSLDGIVFSGGVDVDPARYGAEAHPETDTPQTRRDAGEMALLQAALERDMPTLAICRGVQLLNVARGGDLIQHLPESIGSDEHKQVPGEFAVHPVEIKDGSRLASIVGAGSDVTSHHHQGLGRVGDGLVETAWAADGTLEAVEDPSLRFAVGVQWHPEAAGTRRSSRRSSSRHASTALRARSRLTLGPTGSKRVLRIRSHLLRSRPRGYRRRPAAAFERAFWRRKSGVDRCLPGHSRDPVACLRLLAHEAIAPVEGALDADRHQSGDRGADRRARAGRRRAGRRGRRASEGGISCLAVGVAGRSRPPSSETRDAGRGERRGARSDRVGERGQADRRSTRRDRHGGAGLPLLRRSSRQARRRDDPRGRRSRCHVP